MGATRYISLVEQATLKEYPIGSDFPGGGPWPTIYEIPPHYKDRNMIPATVSGPLYSVDFWYIVTDSAYIVTQTGKVNEFQDYCINIKN